MNHVPSGFGEGRNDAVAGQFANVAPFVVAVGHPNNVAAGRLAGTVLSGALYQWGAQSGPNNGLIACLWASTAFILVAGLLSLLLPRNLGPRTRPIKLDEMGD